MSYYEGAQWKPKEVRAAIITGFHFAMGISEVEALEDRDVMFHESEGKSYVAIIIRGSKTDQQKAGAKRTLIATGCELCPVRTLATWLDMKGWHPNSGEFVFNRRIAYRINHTLKELAKEHGLDETRFSTHSLRAGCAATLYAAGIDPIDIQRWGRWKSAIYMRYIWHGNLRLQYLSEP